MDRVPESRVAASRGAVWALIATPIVVGLVVGAVIVRGDPAPPSGRNRPRSRRTAGPVPDAGRPTTQEPPTAPRSPIAPGDPAVPPPPMAPGLHAEGRSDSLEPDLVLLGRWTVRYTVGRENGEGANIRIPLERLDGTVIRPGTTFDFWRALGEVSTRTGYRRGGIIAGDHIDPDGALAGGICTVSTAIFNAAARAGLDIVARRAHGGYIARYPLGLDAAVAKSDHSTMTMAFRNDTSEAITIRTVSTPGIARVDLYVAEPLTRRVEIGQPETSHRRAATDQHVTSSAVPAGQNRRIEESSDGLTVVVVRTVRDDNGALIHRDRWVSVYRPLRGLVLDGRG